MTAKPAPVDNCISAHAEKNCGNPNRSITPRKASVESQVGSMQFACGYLSPYFITDFERMEVVLENVYILIHEKKISAKKDLLPVLEQVTTRDKPLLIIAEDVVGEALATLVVNNLHGTLQVAAVKTPGSGDERKRMLQDIAHHTCGKAITERLAIQLYNLHISDLGQAKTVTIDTNNTVVEVLEKYEQPSVESEPWVQSKAHTSPLPPSPAPFVRGSHGTLSA